MRNIVGSYHGSNGTRFWVTKYVLEGLKMICMLNWDREDDELQKWANEQFASDQLSVNSEGKTCSYLVLYSNNQSLSHVYIKITEIHVSKC